MQETPRANRIHIGLFGKRNAGKSTLMNKLTRQELSIVSPVPGTTTDSVYKSIEFHPVGPVVFVDTPGIDDEGELGQLRVEKTNKALREVDLIVWVHNDDLSQQEEKILSEIRKKQLPYLLVYNQKEEGISQIVKHHDLVVNAKTEENLDTLREAIAKALETTKEKLCVGDLVQEGDVILLVAPQDVQAPKGRLILPQVQVIRELLDAKAIPITTTYHTLEKSLKALSEMPKLVITDSQIFKDVYNKLPEDIPLTSFSILMARQKGDLDCYVRGIDVIKNLKANDHILIAESCTHNPLHQDIAREQIPKLLQKKCGVTLQFTHTSGHTFPEDLSPYKLVIQCGGCMHTPKQIGARIDMASQQEVPITNFGVILAYFSGILDNIWKG